MDYSNTIDETFHKKGAHTGPLRASSSYQMEFLSYDLHMCSILKQEKHQQSSKFSYQMIA